MIKAIRASELKIGDNIANIGTITNIIRYQPNIKVEIGETVIGFFSNQPVYIHEKGKTK